MKNKKLTKTQEILFKIFIISTMSILIFVLLYISIDSNYNYFNYNEEEICNHYNSTLIDGKCHSETNTSIKELRNKLLIGGIGFPIFAILLFLHMWVLLKRVFNRK